MTDTRAAPSGAWLEHPSDTTKGVRNWASILDDNTAQQARATARCDVIGGHVALMPDAHFGRGATIGSVIVTEGGIIPAAVGVDIGCGMIAALTDLTRADIDDSVLLENVLGYIRREVPAGFSWHATPSPMAKLWIGQNPLPHADATPERAALQLGTLGGGNHFVEVSVDEDDRLWVVLHTGSRGIGNRVAQNHIKKAERVCGEKGRDVPRDLGYYLTSDDDFQVYVDQMLWAQSYAWKNREMILESALGALECFRGGFEVLDTINCHHNYAAEETHNGRNVWVTRKGAIRAGVDDRGVVPGSMGTDTYIVAGLGNPLSWNSAAHGAGRVMSRNQARKRFTADQLAEAMTGKAWESHHAAKLVDEAPWSYKPIGQVMEDQQDLVKPLHKLSALVNYKGA